MRRNKRQQEFQIQGFKKPKVCFGGSLLKSNPKTKRPLESKLPIHVILRASQGGMRLPKVYEKVQKIVYGSAKKYGVRIYEEENVGNHIHLLVKLTRVPIWAAFIREVTGRIAQLLKQHGIAPKTKKFWLYRPYTRIVQGWRKAFQIVKEYIGLNRLEARGMISRKETKTLRDLRLLLGSG